MMMKRKSFTMLEMVCALVLMAVLIVVFSSISSRLGQARNSFANETRAILAVQNTVQRLKLLKDPDRKSAERIFLQEAEYAGAFVPRITGSDDSLELALLNQRKNPVVEVRLKCAK